MEIRGLRRYLRLALLILLGLAAVVAVSFLTRPTRRQQLTFGTFEGQKWLARASEYLLGYSPGWRTPRARYDESLSAYFVDPEGLIEFNGDGSWVYVIINPGHGCNLAMAKDSNGRLYWCEPLSDPCIRIDQAEHTPMKSIKDFVQSQPQIRSRWHIYDPDHPPEFRIGMTILPRPEPDRTVQEDSSE